MVKKKQGSDGESCNFSSRQHFRIGFRHESFGARNLFCSALLKQEMSFDIYMFSHR